MWIIAGWAAFGLMGFLCGCVMLGFTGMTITFWKESIFARFYFGLPSIIILYLFGLGLYKMTSGRISGSELEFLIAIYSGIALSIASGIGAVIFKRHDKIGKHIHENHNDVLLNVARIFGWIACFILFGLSITDHISSSLVYTALAFLGLSYLFLGMKKLLARLSKIKDG